jgi:hypothetical protein
MGRLLSFAGQWLEVCTPDREVLEAIDFLAGAHLRQEGPAMACPLKVERRGDVFHLEGQGPHAPAQVQVEMLEEILAQVLVYRLAERNADHLLLHAAALEFEGRAFLLAAPAGCGKTTLTGWLTTQGFGFLTDELAAVDDAAGVSGFGRPLNVKAVGPELWSRFPWLARDRDSARGGAYLTLIPRPSFQGPPLTVSALVFPRYEAGAGVNAEALRVGQCISDLMICLLNARNLPGHGLPRVSALARRVPAFALRYGNLAEASLWLQGLLGARGSVAPTSESDSRLDFRWSLVNTATQ